MFTSLSNSTTLSTKIIDTLDREEKRMAISTEQLLGLLSRGYTITTFYRVDSFNPVKGEIVSRKFTQFSEIQTTTAKSYLNEAVKKYSPGTVIATVPSSGSLAGKQLQGTLILEVTPQVKTKSIIDHANEVGIVIRDTNGKVYK